MKKNGQQPANVLVGNFFHSLNKQGNVQWQGYVIGSPEPGWYLLQLFEWAMGEPNIRELVRIEDMKGWLFYKNGQEMTFSYDHGAAREGGPYRRRITEPEEVKV